MSLFRVLVGAVVLTAVAAPARAETGLRVEWTAGPEQAVVVVHNDGDSELPGWSVTVGFPHMVTGVTGAISVQDDDRLTLSSPEPLPAGQDVRVSLDVVSLSESAGTSAPAPEPWCESPDVPCVLVADDVENPGESAPATVAPGLDVTYRVAADWGSAQQVAVSVTNAGSRSVSSWTVTIPAGVQVAAVTGADSLSGGGVIRLGRAGADGYLAPGDTIEATLTVSPGGTPEWESCTATADGSPTPCRIGAARSWLAYPELPVPW